MYIHTYIHDNHVLYIYIYTYIFILYGHHVCINVCVYIYGIKMGTQEGLREREKTHDIKDKKKLWGGL